MNSVLQWLVGTGSGDAAGVRDWWLDFNNDYNPYMKFLLLLAAVAMAFLVFRSYRREGQAPRRVKIILGVIRLAVILLVFAMILRPAIVLRFTKTLHKSLVVLIDDSLSMSFSDQYPDAEKANKAANVANVSNRDLSAVPRVELVRKALTRENGPLAKLAQDHPLIVLQFSTAQPGRESYTRPLVTVDKVLGDEETPPPVAKPPPELLAALERLSASGYETNIPAALRDAIGTIQGRRVAGIVLVSDGQTTSGESGNHMASATAYAARLGIPLYAVMVGDPTPPKNAAVISLSAPREVRKGADVEFSALVSHRNLAGQSTKIRLLRRSPDGRTWEPTGSETTFTFEGVAKDGGSSGSQTVRIEHKPQDLGEFVYRAAIEARPDERNPNDNYAEATVKVSDDKINVLLVGGDAGWEFQFLRNFLITQPELFRVSVWQQNADKEVNQSASTGMRLTQLPRTLEGLIGTVGDASKPGYNVVILCDPQPTQEGFDATFAGLLKEFVQRHGGGLCYIAGSKYTESTVRQGPLAGPLSDLLPVVLAPNRIDLAERIGQGQPEPWPMRITSYGLDHSATRFGGSGEETGQLWQMMPGIFWSHPVEKVKPAARVLLENSNPMRRTGRNESEPILVTQPFGTGRVLYLGTNETWRMRPVNDGYFYRRFWSNVVRYLATLKARQVVITTGGDRFSVSEKIAIEAEVFDKEFQPLKAPTFDVELINRETSSSQTVTLKAQPGKAGQYKLAMAVPHTGRYELTALKGDPLAAEKVASKQFTVELPQDEAARTEANQETMQSIASRPENFVTLGDLEKLAIPSARTTLIEDRPRELWDTKLSLVLAVLLLTIEWILRKRYNMT